MGYETKLYFGEPSSHSDGPTAARWVDIIASVDLCKVGSPEDLGLVGQKRPQFYFYDGSDRRIMRDLYGECLTVGTRDDVLMALKAKSEGDDYRRYAVAIAILRSLTKKHFPRLVVLGYGH